MVYHARGCIMCCFGGERNDEIPVLVLVALPPGGLRFEVPDPFYLPFSF